MGEKMSIIAWTPKLSVGIEAIDQQHKELIRRLNLFVSAMKQGKGKAQVAQVLAFLEEYVVTHFRDEETAMQRYGYPSEDFGEHRQAHQGFVRQVQQIKEQLDQEGITLPFVVNLQLALAEWLIDHIGRTDVAMGAFIKGHPDYPAKN